MAPTETTELNEKTILIVDDTPANVGVLVDYLEERGFRVVVAQDGEDAIMRAQFVFPDIILLDVMMPGMDGFETCRRLKTLESTKDIPVIFMTALSDTSEKVAGFSVGGVDYVTKPFQIEEVLARLTTHLALRETTQQLMRTVNALNLAQAELVHSEKLAALGALVAGIAHELNTPIGNSLMVASTLADQTRALSDSYASENGLKRSVLESFIGDVNKAGDMLVRNLYRAAHLVTSFKQVAVDRTSSQRRKFSLAEMLAETMLTLWPTLKNTPYTVTQSVSDAIVFDSYPGPLGQVVTNLVNNALIHGFEGRDSGTVSIAAQAREQGWIELTIKDDGNGIPPANLPRIFDPFFTTKLGAGGSGLGLNICHNIVTGVLGGHIAVESEVGVGTSFVITLPLQATLLTA